MAKLKNLESYHVAVVGAAGVVGEEMIHLLEERDFPVRRISPLDSAHSVGACVEFCNTAWAVEEIGEGVFNDVDIALFSAGEEISRRFAPMAVKSGAVVIDNTKAFNGDSNVPLIVPEINPEAIEKHQGIIANPNGSTILLVLTLKPIHDAAGIERVVVSTYQSVSQVGKAAMEELRAQVQALFNMRDVSSEVLPHRIAFNCLPHIDEFQEDGYTNEEHNLIEETR